MKKQLNIAAFGVCLLACTPVFSQSSGDAPSGDVDPIAIVSAHVLKGQTNRMQRRAIRTEWLTVAAQQAEDFLRTSAFNKIIEFVQKNHELFESIYAGLKTANQFVSTGKRVKSVIALQRKLIVKFATTGELLLDSEFFTAEELESFSGTLELVMRDTGANFDLLVTLFRGTSRANLTDMERFEVLSTIEERLAKNLQAVDQLNRYIVYLDTNRGVQMDSGLPNLLTETH